MTEYQRQDYAYGMVYYPPLTAMTDVDIDFPFLGKIYKIKKVPVKNHIAEVGKKVHNAS